MSENKCPSCGFDVIAGMDRCSQCFHSLMQIDLPQPTHNDSLQNVVMTAPISELVTGEDLLVADPSDKLDKIVELFQREGKNCILIYKNHKLVGILSRRDLLRKVAGIESDLSKVSTQDVMTTNPEYVCAEDPIAYVINKMALGGFRHVPVLASDGSPISIIAVKDVLEHLSRAV